MHGHGRNGEVVHRLGVNLVYTDFYNLVTADDVSVCIVLSQWISGGDAVVVGDCYRLCFLVEYFGIGKHIGIEINGSGVVGKPLLVPGYAFDVGHIAFVCIQIERVSLSLELLQNSHGGRPLGDYAFKLDRHFVCENHTDGFVFSIVGPISVLVILRRSR